MTVYRDRIEVQFSTPPEWTTRRWLKNDWRFVFDGTRWVRRNDINLNRFLDEAVRYGAPEWELYIANAGGEPVPARLVWTAKRGHELVEA
jgi:hypothetical protein